MASSNGVLFRVKESKLRRRFERAKKFFLRGGSLLMVVDTKPSPPGEESTSRSALHPQVMPEDVGH